MSGLSAPGSSAYSSDTMYVGDGTWDSQRNTFLLPNLQGLNLATTQYNGMGNRFQNMNGYHGLILAHGILAVCTFLFVVPAAIFLARFYHRNPRMALRLHIWLQLGTVFLSTAIFVLGFQAVGRKRSLTNPHHGTGVALYTMILVQAIGGCVIHRREKGKERYKIPLKLMLHQWIGRLIALLGIIQVALGLTLYGSPMVLFILYAVWGLILICAWFVLCYMNQPEMGFDETSTYITETTMSGSRRSHRGHGMGSTVTASAAGAGLAAWGNRSRSRSTRRGPSGGRREVLSSHPGTYYTDSRVDEKYTEVGRKNHTWRERLLGAGAATGGIFAFKSLFGKKKVEPSVTTSNASYSRPPIGQSEVTQTDLSRVEEGRAPASPGRDHWRRVEEREAAQAAAMGASPLRQGHRATRSGVSMESFDSRTSLSDDLERPKESHGLRDGIAALGFAGFLKHQWSKRRNKKEDAHVAAVKEQDLEDERIARANSQRRKFTGDGLPPRNNGPPSTIFSESDISGTTPGLSRRDVRPPRNTTHLTQTETVAGPSMTPAPPLADPHGVLSDVGSEAYVSAGGHKHRRHHNGGASALGAATAAGASSDIRDASQRRGSRDGSVNSPPVSVKVKMHNDGRHVTLRRLNEEEAAAEREARKKDRRRRDGSMSSLSNLENNERWRRTAAMEAAQAQEMGQGSAPIAMPEPMIPGPPPMATTAGHQSPLPLPPPIPGAGGSIMSSPQGTQVYGTETDVSAYDSNRRRRRAERAQAKQARLGGSRVEFS
ncbi:hypothetical protein P171DRAFT_395449 [Karstenula rhodostoma CBS 690.94]|uniref:Cytochrome b561 domain-containing protein n=1 Tax=Karstenula rhodostoma CBS 690.94 TaxID=1392251 RepID=A0A9P4U8D2_9PLEO|nr:hypothetical protein P171DRAFT_395449 [Karstenula rhodostoma CBS 690.94]